MAFTLPDNLADLTEEQLSELVDKALDALRALNLTEDSDDAAITEGEALAEALGELRSAQKAQAEVKDARRKRTQSILENLDAPKTDEDGGEKPAEASDEAAPPTAAVEEKQPEAVVASAKPSPVIRAASNAPEIRTPRGGIAITASADVPGWANGQHMASVADIGMAAVARMRGMPTSRVGEGIQHSYGVAQIRKEGYGDLVQDNFNGDDDAMLTEAARTSRLPGGSLVAAGGWCAPSETLYDICPGTTVEGILSLPEFAVTRGGIRYTPQPDFSTIYSACGFQQTEAQAIAGTCKTCCEPTCPSFTEVRMDLIGLCIKAPLLTKQAYPEWISYFTGEALAGFQHKVNQYLIAKMVAAAGTAITAPYNDQKAMSLTLNALEWQAVALRQRWRLGINRTIEVIAPIWLKTALRIDLSMRLGADLGAVTDAQINSWFTSRNLSVQWIYDWQELTFTGKAPNVPATVQVLMYPDGTWQRGSASVINVEAVYDSVGLESNVYTALFMEEGILAVQRCLETDLVQLPVCMSGRTAAQNLTACFPAAQA